MSTYPDLLDKVTISGQVFTKNKESLGEGSIGVIYEYKRSNTDTKLGNEYDNLNMLRPLEDAEEIIIKYSYTESVETKKQQKDIKQIKKNLEFLKKNIDCAKHFTNFGIYKDTDLEYIIMEKANMDLFEYISENKSELKDEQILNINIKLLEILKCLQDNYKDKEDDYFYTFTDFKFENIGVFSDNDDKLDLKLIDIDGWGINDQIALSDIYIVKKIEDTKLDFDYILDYTDWEKYHIINIIIKNIKLLYDGDFELNNLCNEKKINDSCIINEDDLSEFKKNLVNELKISEELKDKEIIKKFITLLKYNDLTYNNFIRILKEEPKEKPKEEPKEKPKEKPKEESKEEEEKPNNKENKIYLYIFIGFIILLSILITVLINKSNVVKGGKKKKRR